MTTSRLRRPRPHARRAAVALAAPVLVAALALAGCGGGGGNSTGSGAVAPGGAGDSAGGGMAARPDAPLPSAGRAADGAGGGVVGGTGKDESSGLPGGRVLLRPPTSVGRSIVYTAELTVRVDDVTAKADRATALVTAAGGYLFGDRSTGGRTAELTYKVPAPKFAEVLVQLGRLGTRLSSSAAAQDVSQEVVDLRSRVTTARASVARVRALLAKATSLGQVVDIEGELTQREADLESMEGQLAVLTDQVALSTVTLHLTKPRHAVAPPAHHDRASFVTGLRHGWHAFVTAAVAVVTVLGAALPFLGVLAVLAAGWWWGRRAVRARRAPVGSGTSA